MISEFDEKYKIFNSDISNIIKDEIGNYPHLRWNRGKGRYVDFDDLKSYENLRATVNMKAICRVGYGTYISTVADGNLKLGQENFGRNEIYFRPALVGVDDPRYTYAEKKHVLFTGHNLKELEKYTGISLSNIIENSEDELAETLSNDGLPAYICSVLNIFDDYVSSLKRNAKQKYQEENEIL